MLSLAPGNRNPRKYSYVLVMLIRDLLFLSFVVDITGMAVGAFGLSLFTAFLQWGYEGPLGERRVYAACNLRFRAFRAFFLCVHLFFSGVLLSFSVCVVVFT